MSEVKTNPTPIVWLKFGVRAVLGVAILVVGLGIFMLLAGTKTKAPRSELADRSFEVRSITVELVAAPRVWTGYGTGRAKSSANVTSEVAGIVANRPDEIDPGVWVDVGTLLVQIDDTEYLAILTRAEERASALEADIRGLDIEAESISDSLEFAKDSVRLTQDQLERLRSAVGAGGASRFETEILEQQLSRELREQEGLEERLNLVPTRRARLRAQFEGERADVRVAQLNVERCRIESPIAGILQEVSVDEGERLAIDQSVARVVDLRLIEIPLKLPVSAATRLTLGDRAELIAAGPSGMRWEGAVVRIAPEADAATRTVTVFVEVEQASEDRPHETAHIGGMLLPGQFLSGRVYTGEQAQRVIVPRAAVQRDRVMIVDGTERAEPRIVRVAYHIDGSFPTLHPHERQWAVLESGIDPGDRVIISNLDDLVAGSPVRPLDAAGALAGGNGGDSS